MYISDTLLLVSWNKEDKYVTIISLGFNNLSKPAINSNDPEKSKRTLPILYRFRIQTAV